MVLSLCPALESWGTVANTPLERRLLMVLALLRSYRLRPVTSPEDYLAGPLFGVKRFYRLGFCREIPGLKAIPNLAGLAVQHLAGRSVATGVGIEEGMLGRLLHVL